MLKGEKSFYPDPRSTGASSETFLFINLVLAATEQSQTVVDPVIGTTPLPKDPSPNDKEDYLALSISGKNHSGTVSWIQVRGQEFAEANCSISYCLGYFFFRGPHLWIDIQVIDKSTGNDAEPIRKSIGFMNDNGDIELYDIEGLEISWYTVEYTFLEKVFGASNSAQMSMSVPAASL